MEALKFCVASREKGICSYVWRLWWGRTSFYIKPVAAPMSAYKVSLHGPDSRHPSGPVLKLEEDRTVPARHKIDLAAVAFNMPVKFSGREITRRSRHVIRLRVPWDMFISGQPSAPGPTGLKSNVVGAIVPAPPPLHAADIDIFLSEGRPHWPKERRARADNSCLGPLLNEANQFLTAVSVRRSLLKVPTLPTAVMGRPADGADRVRGIGAAVDDHGVLWICEQWMSGEELLQAADALTGLTEGVEERPRPSTVD